ncbi:Uma2 family endonuclease [Streptomyces rimosus]|uniref:Uma2 family endonuclease n=1 Tax=Streptomyces rimosus TaxID=1927 RepID=UPI0005182DB2|nr:Uma2 family endonuclease [Streptomyces rimosus]
MTALAPDVSSELDEALWQAWEALEAPEGFRAEIVEGAIEVWRTGQCTQARRANRLRDALGGHLAGSPYMPYQCMYVVHRRSVWAPDVLIALRNADEDDAQDVGIRTSAVPVIAEVVAPGQDDITRDRCRKRRAYARAGIPVYVLIDDYDGRGTVTVLTAPRPAEATYAAEHRVPYGTDITIPEGPAKGFIIDETITGPPRGDR